MMISTLALFLAFRTGTGQSYQRCGKMADEARSCLAAPCPSGKECPAGETCWTLPGECKDWTPCNDQNTCKDTALPAAWGSATCGTYDGQYAYCGHDSFKESCCFCGGGECAREGDGPSDPIPAPTSIPTLAPEPTQKPTKALSGKKLCKAQKTEANCVSVITCVPKIKKGKYKGCSILKCKKIKDEGDCAAAGCEATLKKGKFKKCVDPSPSPPTTPKPTTILISPTPNPTEKDTVPEPTSTPASNEDIQAVLDGLEASNSDNVFMYETPSSSYLPSDIYLWKDMIKAVQSMAERGIGEKKLWVGGDAGSDTLRQNYGLVNVAAFLSQAMQESIRYNACDENNWSNADVTAGHGGAPYSAASACGQLEQSYQDYECTPEEDEIAGGQMACSVDPNMEMRAFTQAKWYGAPPALFCAPRSKMPNTPRWDYNNPSWCQPPVTGIPHDKFGDYLDFVNSGGGCGDYDGQKAGGWTFSGDGCVNGACPGAEAPLFGQPAGRTDVEGCCWWGRGAIQSTGTCNYGKLNYYMGKRAADEGRDSLFPDIDFCENPNSVCDPSSPAELKWIAGFFYWLNAVQPYEDTEDGWNYITELKAWVDNGMDTNDYSFVDGASGIVNRGCHNPPNCGTGELHAKSERRKNFVTVIEAMGLA